MGGILWHNSLTNETQIWYMDRERVTSRATLVFESNGAPAIAGPPWTIVAISYGEFDSYGPKIWWHNSATNEMQLWSLFNYEVAARPTVLGEDGKPAYVGPPFSIVGGMQGGRSSGVLWHHSGTNESQFWYTGWDQLQGRDTVLWENGAPALIGPPWSVAGVGHFQTDYPLKQDILWHNTVTNETQIWYMDGPRATGRPTVLFENGKPALVGPPWSIVGVGDMTGEGTSDIVWHNSASKEIQIWIMDGYQIKGRPMVRGEDGKLAYVGPPWRIVGASDIFHRDQVRRDPADPK